VLDDDRRKSIEAEVDGEIQRAVAVAEAGPLEPVEDLARHVMSEPA
jgi:pyruvate dehydrogenase E1 component alpha subunit